MTRDGHHHLHVVDNAIGAEFQVAIPSGKRRRETAKIRLEFYADPDCKTAEDWGLVLHVNRKTGAIALQPDNDSVHAIIFGDDDDFPILPVL